MIHDRCSASWIAVFAASFLFPLHLTTPVNPFKIPLRFLLLEFVTNILLRTFSVHILGGNPCVRFSLQHFSDGVFAKGSLGSLFAYFLAQ